MPTVRHLTGPLAGQEQTIDPRVDRITFGRDPAACDVVFPPELTVVARRHFAFVRRPSGEWLFEDFGDPFVAVNGRPAEIDEGIPTGAKVELGRVGGPSFQIFFEGKQLDSVLPVTAVQQKVSSSREAAARARRLAFAGVAVALVAAVIAGGVLWFNRNEGAKLEAAFDKLAKAQADVAADSISSTVRDRVMQAAHVVVVQYASGQVSAQGTASPIGPDLFVTNAHVAVLRDSLGPNDKLLVRAPGANGKTYEVTETKIHPGYKAFNAFLNEDPIFVTSAKGCPTCFPSLLKGSLSYDVALMRVPSGSNAGPVLEIATPQELTALRPGTPLGLAGYPLENIQGSEVQGLSATPNLRTGMITAITDMFNLPGEPAEQRLIHHNIPVTGGNSGSPMVAGNGKLVALLNSGNVLAAAGGGRMPNAAIINYAQRADLVTELLDGTAEANLGRERAYWAKQTATFQRGFDLIVPQVLAELKPASAVNPTLVSQTKFTLTGGDQFKGKDKEGKEAVRRQKIHSVQLKAKVPGVFIAYAQDRAPIQLYLVVNGNIVQQNDRGIWFPAIRYGFDQDQTADIYVVSPDKDVNYTLLQYSFEAPPS